MTTYTERATEYVRETIKKHNLTKPDDIREFFDNELYGESGDYLNEELTLEEIKASVKANEKFVYEAYVSYTDASYEEMWEDFMNEEWRYFDHCARRYSLSIAADDVAEEKEKENENMKKNNNMMLADIIEVFEKYLERKGIEIPNPEKEPDCGAQIYGTEFAEMMDEIREVLDVYGVKVPDKWE